MPFPPERGSTITVDPITSKRSVADIKAILANNPRDLCLFTVGINVALRASDLVRLTCGDVATLEIGAGLRVAEKKTRGRRGRTPRVITWNQAAHEATRAWLARHPDSAATAPLFPSQKGHGILTVSHVHRLVKTWCRRVGLKGNYGSHTLRKTWGYHQRATFGTELSVIMQALGHTNPKDTMRYIGIQPEEISDAYMHSL
jgi:integrase